MFVKTVKVKKPNSIALIGVLILSLILIAIWIVGGSKGGVGDKYPLANNNERVEFLKDLGWEVSTNEITAKVVKIPEEFNEIYLAYNILQKEQGFDLLKYKGETVEIYTYDIYNYPNKDKNISVHLIILDGLLIGGDVSCTEIDGFMQGLMPTKENKENMIVTTAPDLDEESGSENEYDEEKLPTISTDTIIIEK